MSRSFLARAKDAVLEKAVVAFLQPKAERYGEILSLSIDSSSKSVSAEIRLHGEPTPIEISRAFYRLEQDGPQGILIIYNVKISREWMQKLLEDQFSEIRIKVPDAVTKLLA